MSGSLIPKPHTVKPGQEITASLLNRLSAMVDRTLRGAGSVGVQDFGDRVTVTFDDSRPSLPSEANYLQQFVVILELDDLLVCVRYDEYRDATRSYYQVYSNTLGLDDIAIYYVAKPYALQRTPWDGQEIILGGYKASVLPHSTFYAGGQTTYIATYFDNQIGRRFLSTATYYDTPGSVTIPTAIGGIYVLECWGGGAGGSDTTGNGGGGGAYARKTYLAVATGISAYVAHGGTANANGETTWAVSSTVVAAGGGAGTAAGTATNGDVVHKGGMGGPGTATLGGGGGGSGLTTRDGYQGESAQDSNGTNAARQGNGGMGYGRGGDGGNAAGKNGSTAGGGGGGRGPSVAAGIGADGRIRVTVQNRGVFQTIFPNYQIGEIIVAARVRTGYQVQPQDLTQPPELVVWMDVNHAGRSWQSDPISVYDGTQTYGAPISNSLIVGDGVVKIRTPNYDPTITIPLGQTQIPDARKDTGGILNCTGQVIGGNKYLQDAVYVGPVTLTTFAGSDIAFPTTLYPTATGLIVGGSVAGSYFGTIQVVPDLTTGSGPLVKLVAGAGAAGNGPGGTFDAGIVFHSGIDSTSCTLTQGETALVSSGGWATRYGSIAQHNLPANSDPLGIAAGVWGPLCLDLVGGRILVGNAFGYDGSAWVSGGPSVNPSDSTVQVLGSVGGVLWPMTFSPGSAAIAAPYTGNVTISGTTLHIKNGVITSVS